MLKGLALDAEIAGKRGGDKTVGEARVSGRTLCFCLPLRPPHVQVAFALYCILLNPKQGKWKYFPL